MAEAKEKEETVKEEAKTPDGRKLYKGEKLTVADLVDRLPELRMAPVQPMVRKFKTWNFEQEVPPSFVVTRFHKSPGKTVQMHFYNPANKQRLYRDIPLDFELNLLTGRRGQELAKEWNDKIERADGDLFRRATVTMGSDPELFVVNAKGVIPAWEFLGSKEKPNEYKSTDGYFKGEVYWDGFQAEFTTPAGIGCLAQLGDALHYGLKKVYERAKKHDPSAKLSTASVLPVDEAVLQSAEEKYVQFGCAPSVNAYGLSGNTQSGRVVPYRFAGGHIHFGTAQINTDKKWLNGLVRNLDNILGVAAVSMFAAHDNPVRRQYYGQPGEFRTPAHGLEYRTLSNAWLAHPLIYHMTFDLARAVVGMYEEGMDFVWKTSEKATVETIMNHDVDSARKILKENERIFRAVLRAIGHGYATAEGENVAYDIWTKGMEHAIATPDDIEGNWNLAPKQPWHSHSEGAGASFYKAYKKILSGSKV
jgi:hypothetical protein